MNLAKPETATCLHCGAPVFGQAFCCPGCHAAHDLIQGLGLGGYYARRAFDPAQRTLKPEPADSRDLTRFIVPRPDGALELTLALDGLQCGACVWLIESVLAREPGLDTGRVNMTTRRLRLVWRGAPEQAAVWCARVESLGYRLVAFDPAALAAATDATGRDLIRRLAVAGFAAGNVMLLSLATWFGVTQNMGPATRELLHWVSALVALPAIAYAGQPFFRSALGALRHFRTNMDVPISIGVLLVSAMSLWQTRAGGTYTYFDSGITLLFFLLIGRVLDHRARGRARATAEQLLLLRAADVAVLARDGTVSRLPQDRVTAGARVLVGMGERVGVDGVLEGPAALMDASLVTGESLPARVDPGGQVFAGTINLGEATTIRATATGSATLLAECARLIEAAEQARGRFVVLADRVARRYAPTVHLSALGTFLVWALLLHRGMAPSLLAASAVLIITCPCALALAVPAVQVIATARLFRAGILLKSPTALERLATVDHVVADKTGTLTDPDLGLAAGADPDALREAATLAASSRHPLCRALVRAADGAAAAPGVREIPGAGLQRGETRLGSRAFCGLPPAPAAPPGPELCLVRPGQPPAIFHFREYPRRDAAETIAALRALGLTVEILSGDQPDAVRRVAATLNIATWRAGCSPIDKMRHVEALRAAGRRVLMLGDGLNDGPCLAAADVSASPATAADVSQTVADAVFQGDALSPIPLLLATARRARAVMGQNLALSLGYNLLMMPLAMAGYVTPWLAALAMSTSSLLVMANALRVQRVRPCSP